ncbi:MAG: KEOPS complex subunit Cgi121 [Candidatus Thermoplasmatota archaeon]
MDFAADLVGAWEREVPEGGAKALMEDVLAEASASGSEALVMDGDMVFGADHVASALHHAAKAAAEGRNSSDSLAMETLLYASGERQLSAAIRKMSVGGGTRRVVLAVLRGSFGPGEGWAPLPPVDGAADRARLRRFGVTDVEMSTVAEGRLSELVLERVAAVDVIKR